MPGMQMPGCRDSPGGPQGDQQSLDQSSAKVDGHPESLNMQMGETGLMRMHPQTFRQSIAHHAGSGTSAQPNSTPTYSSWLNPFES